MAEPVRARRLTDQEGRRLLQIVRRGKHGSVRVRRAMIIMASASGTLVPAIARLAAADEGTVRDRSVRSTPGLATPANHRWAEPSRPAQSGGIAPLVMGGPDHRNQPRAGPQAAGLPALA